MFALSRDEMREIDSYVISEYGIPGRLLMELAGKGCADVITGKIPAVSRVLLICGTGNNGGDGFVIARWLKNYGHTPVVVVSGNIEKMSSETKANYLLLQKLNIRTLNPAPEEIISECCSDGFQSCRYDAIVDALYGTGFKGDLPEAAAEFMSYVNQLSGVRFAVDIPSGLDGDNGITSIAFKADYTMTMAAPKRGHYLGKGKDYCGELITIDIGVPLQVWTEKRPQVQVLTGDEVVLPERRQTFHKGDYGRIAVIAGSRGYTGAAILSCRAALKSGAGLITLYHPAGLEDLFETALTEVMTKTLEYNSNEDSLPEGLADSDVLLIGPGIRVSGQTVALLERITALWQKPAVFDADALNILAAHPQWLERLRDKPVVLTPHIGEFARLMHLPMTEILQNPVACMRKFVDKYRCAVLLKSSYRLYADVQKTILDVSGNDGLATGGSGDVLAGVIASFLAQKCTVADAAVSGSYILGKTAEKCTGKYHSPAITPSMIIENLFSR